MVPWAVAGATEVVAGTWAAAEEGAWLLGVVSKAVASVAAAASLAEATAVQSCSRTRTTCVGLTGVVEFEGIRVEGVEGTGVGGRGLRFQVQAC